MARRRDDQRPLRGGTHSPARTLAELRGRRIRLEQYEAQTQRNVDRFYGDAKGFLEKKHGLIGGLLVDIFSNKSYALSVVNSFKAVVFDDGATIMGGAKRDSIFGSNASEKFQVTAGGDVILARGGNDIIYLGKAYDGAKISGGDGFDKIIVDAPSNSYFYKKTTPLGEGMTGPDGLVELSGVERIVFFNGTVAADTGAGQTAGSAYRIYQAAFARTPDMEGLKFWINKMDGGENLLNVAQGFLNAAEAIRAYGADPNASDFVSRLYRNVLGRDGEAGGVQFWNTELARGAGKAQVLASFSESPENVQNVGAFINDGIFIV